ncbi:MAG: hypothetical protein ACREV3_07735 [Gammaproteobacteria bacterium]
MKGLPCRLAALAETSGRERAWLRLCRSALAAHVGAPATTSPGWKNKLRLLWESAVLTDCRSQPYRQEQPQKKKVLREKNKFHETVNHRDGRHVGAGARGE